MDNLKEDYRNLFSKEQHVPPVETTALSADSSPVISPSSKPVLNEAASRPVIKPNIKNSAQVRNDIVAFAKRYLGTPYVYAASSPADGFDCSGFINFVYRSFGFTVPRTSQDFSHAGVEVGINSVKKGDLLIFTGTEPNSTEVGHIGIVTEPRGMQSEFIHSSSGKAQGVTISSLGSAHYTTRFVKAISVIP